MYSKIQNFNFNFSVNSEFEGKFLINVSTKNYAFVSKFLGKKKYRTATHLVDKYGILQEENTLVCKDFF